MFTRESILNLLETNNKMVERSIIVIFERQTADEQQSYTTNRTNGRGFNGVDAHFGTVLANVVIANKYNRMPGEILSIKQRQIARKMLKKYVGQLVEEANNRQGKGQ